MPHNLPKAAVTAYYHPMFCNLKSAENALGTQFGNVRVSGKVSADKACQNARQNSDANRRGGLNADRRRKPLMQKQDVESICGAA